MRILVTNDDGINAPGLVVAETIANEIAGPDGEVWVIAPAFEQSGVSHAMSYIRPMRIEKHGPRRYAVEGTPADCVLAGMGDVMKDTPPDLILSGVNRGHNVAEDTVYSGTIGAAMEANLRGTRAIAMSQYFGEGNHRLEEPFEAAYAHAPGVIKRLLADAPWNEASYAVFYNINFPPVPADQAKSTVAAFQGRRASPTFDVDPHDAPNGRRFLWLTHGKGNGDTEPGSDAFECMNGHVTVTPLRADMTAHNIVPDLGKLLSRD